MVLILGYFVSREKHLLWEQEIRSVTSRTPSMLSVSFADIMRSHTFGRVPAFQADCRGFESRLPLHALNRLFTGSRQAASWQASGERVSKQAVLCCAKRCTATSCLILG